MPVGTAAILSAFQGGRKGRGQRADCLLWSFLTTRSFKIGQDLVNWTHLAAREPGACQFTQQDTIPGKRALSKLPQVFMGSLGILSL